MYKKKYQFCALLAILLFSNCTPYFEIPYDTASYDISSIGPFDCSREYSIAKDEASGRFTSKEVEKISPDGRTKIVIKYYKASTFKFDPYSSLVDSKRSNRLSISVDADEVIVGGGAAVLCDTDNSNWWLPRIYDEYHKKTKALLTSSYPVDDNTFSKWAADSKDFEFPEPAFNHHLDVYAVGMKIFFDGKQIPVSTLRANMEILKDKWNFRGGQRFTQHIIGASPGFIPLSGGMKNCWSGNRGGIYFGHLFFKETFNGGYQITGGSVAFQGENKVVEGTTELYGLIIRNINPINPSKTLLKIQHDFTTEISNRDFKDLEDYIVSDEAVIISAYGITGELRYWDYDPFAIQDPEYFEWGMMALFAYSLPKGSPWGQLNVGGHGDGPIFDQKSSLGLVKISPGQ